MMNSKRIIIRKNTYAKRGDACFYVILYRICLLKIKYTKKDFTSAGVAIIIDICTFNPKTFREYLQNRKKYVNITYI